MSGALHAPAARSHPVAPLQLGMLFNVLAAPSSGVDLEQIVFSLGEPLDVERLQWAWQRVVERHAALRSAFKWVGVSEPAQLEYGEVPVALDERDVRMMSPDAREAALKQYLEFDRGLGFDLSSPPLFRLTLFRFDRTDYRLVWTFPHALLDGRSFPIVIGDVFRYYDAGPGSAPALPAPRTTWEYERSARSAASRGAEAYWREVLRGFESPTPLPFDHGVRGRSGTHSAKYAATDRSLGVDASTALTTLATQCGVSLYTVIEAAWGLALSRYSGEQTVVFGATRACRHSDVEGTATAVGFMMNTLPVRVDVDDDRTVAEWLAAVRRRQIEVRAFEDTPLRMIHAWSEVSRGVPLFETLLVFERGSMAETLKASSPQWSNRDFRILRQASYPLTLAGFGGPLVRLELLFDTERLTSEAAERILEHLVTLLARMAANGGARVAHLSMLTETERDEVVHRRNATDAAMPPVNGVHELFEARARAAPDSVAVVSGGVSYTYAELDAAADQVALRLVRRGVGPEVPVILCVRRSFRLVAGTIGILKAGGAFVPLDPELPSGRISFIVRDSRATVVLTEMALSPLFVDCGCDVVEIDAVADGESPGSRRARGGDGAPHRLAYVIYTSGTTGEPKGVEVEHAGLVNLVAWHARAFEVGVGDRCSFVAGLGFDAAVWELWGCLCSGASLYPVPEEIRTAPDALRDWIIANEITVSFLPTPLAEAVLRLDWPSASRLRVLLTGGDLLHSFAPAAASFRLVNNYGPTETTVVATSGVVDGARAAIGRGRPDIGAPIANTRCYVLDALGRPTAIGVPGELHIGGVGVARGYRNRPQDTAERFVTSPLLDVSGRLYRSGDRVRWRPNGTLEFLGRVDAQIKIRGFRIEPGEVEAQLLSHRGIAEALVLAVDDDRAGRRLIACIVAVDDAPSANALRAHLAHSLPDYMIPAVYLPCTRLPLTANGKVDRRAVKELARAHSAQDSFVEPETDVERIIARAFRDVLAVDRVGKHDDFFALGGDSFGAMQLVAKAARFGVQIAASDIFRQPTVGELARRAQTARVVARSREPASGQVPLTPIQEWFFEYDVLDPHHWNFSLMLEASVRLSKADVRRAATTLRQQHDALRLRFVREGPRWRQQCVGPDEDDGCCGWIDVSHLRGEAQRTEIARHAGAFQTSLSLEKGPLFRVITFDRGPECQQWLLVIAHHLVADGYSWEVLLADLEAACVSAHAGRPTTVTGGTSSYCEWAGVLADLATSPALAAEAPYWLDEVRHRCGRIAPDFPAGVATRGSTATSPVSLGAEESRALTRLASRALDLRVSDVLIAAFSASLAEWQDTDVVLFNMVDHARDGVVEGLDMSATVGWVNIHVPILIRLMPHVDPLAFLLDVRGQLRAIPRRGLGYGLLRYGPDATMAARLRAQPQPEVDFNYLSRLRFDDRPSQLFRRTSESVGEMQNPAGMRPFPLGMRTAVRNDAFVFHWHYSRNVFRAATIDALAARFHERLRELLSLADQKVQA